VPGNEKDQPGLWIGFDVAVAVKPFVPATSGINSWLSFKTLMNPGKPPFGDASQSPLPLLVAMTQKGE
jgi:hypothetical protein